MSYRISMLIFIMLLPVRLILAQIGTNDHDISVEAGILAMTKTNDTPVGTLFSAQYTYFYKNRVGLRTGFNFVDQLDNYNYFSVPFLCVLRTNFELGLIYEEVTSFEDLILGAILFFVPRQFELIGGTSLGWLSQKGHYKSDLILNYKFAPTIDLQLRLVFAIWRFGLVGTMGIAFLPINNFKSTSNYTSTHLLFRGSVGVQYKFY